MTDSKIRHQCMLETHLSERLGVLTCLKYYWIMDKNFFSHASIISLFLAI